MYPLKSICKKKGEQQMTLKEILKEKGMTQTQLSALSGVNLRQISRLANGEAKPENITTKNLLAIAKALHVAPESLMQSGLPSSCDIIVSVYQAYKPGNLAKYGPGRMKTWGAFAGVSLLSTRPEGPSVIDRIKECGWRIDHELGGIGQPPWRKIVKIELPSGIHYGNFSLAGCSMYGLYSDYSAKDGMGRCVYCYCRESIPVTGDNSDAIDQSIASGIMLSAPVKDGNRIEIEAKVLAVSDIYGYNAPQNWTIDD